MNTEKLIKGRVAEVVFEQMFNNKKRYRVLHHGYEYITPELAGIVRDKEDETFKMISKSPDFLLHDLQEKKLFLVEVKYMSKFRKSHAYDYAEELKERHWGLSKLFIVTPDAFYYDDIENILENKGVCKNLSVDMVPESTQKKYLDKLSVLQ